MCRTDATADKSASNVCGAGCRVPSSQPTHTHAWLANHPSLGRGRARPRHAPGQCPLPNQSIHPHLIDDAEQFDFDRFLPSKFHVRGRQLTGASGRPRISLPGQFPPSPVHSCRAARGSYVPSLSGVARSIDRAATRFRLGLLAYYDASRVDQTDTYVGCACVRGPLNTCLFSSCLSSGWHSHQGTGLPSR